MTARRWKAMMAALEPEIKKPALLRWVRASMRWSRHLGPDDDELARVHLEGGVEARLPRAGSGVCAGAGAGHSGEPAAPAGAGAPYQSLAGKHKHEIEVAIATAPLRPGSRAPAPDVPSSAYVNGASSPTMRNDDDALRHLDAVAAACRGFSERRSCAAISLARAQHQKWPATGAALADLEAGRKAMSSLRRLVRGVVGARGAGRAPNTPP